MSRLMLCYIAICDPSLAIVQQCTIRVHPDFHAEIVEVEIEVVSPSIVPSGNFPELNCTVTFMVLKANDRRTSSPMPR
ncbi:hypothetical protein TNCV_2839671 [Trichonephila clavipes]|nr:hypothetical protein TNCV_2839671 [Trichonephila clavipes]